MGLVWGSKAGKTGMRYDVIWLFRRLYRGCGMIEEKRGVGVGCWVIGEGVGRMKRGCGVSGRFRWEMGEEGEECV